MWQALFERGLQLLEIWADHISLELQGAGLIRVPVGEPQLERLFKVLDAALDRLLHLGVCVLAERTTRVTWNGWQPKPASGDSCTCE